MQTQYEITHFSGLDLDSSVKLSHIFPTASTKFGFCLKEAEAAAIVAFMLEAGSIFQKEQFY